MICAIGIPNNSKSAFPVAKYVIKPLSYENQELFHLNQLSFSSWPIQRKPRPWWQHQIGFLMGTVQSFYHTINHHRDPVAIFCFVHIMGCYKTVIPRLAASYIKSQNCRRVNGSTPPVGRRGKQFLVHENSDRKSKFLFPT
jgi:hypothetical protein